jgi:outer membrane protein assembly factor BamD (BamD/ComL family)
MDTTQTIDLKNLSNDWKNGISFTKEYPRNDNVKYVLYPTGKCDLNGRKYVAIPENVHIPSNYQLKNKYHII